MEILVITHTAAARHASVENTPPEKVYLTMLIIRYAVILPQEAAPPY